jgi:hypothetical protein
MKYNLVYKCQGCGCVIKQPTESQRELLRLTADTIDAGRGNFLHECSSAWAGVAYLIRVEVAKEEGQHG